MSNETQNLSKLLHFTESLCAFADDVSKYHDFDLSGLVAETRKYRQAVIDDIEDCSDDEWGDDIEDCSDDEWGDEVADKPKSFFDELFVPEFTTEKTSNDEITMSDFDTFRLGMPDTVQTMFNLVLPLSIIEEAEAHEKATEPMTKEKRIKAIEMHTMLKLARIAVS